MSSVGIVSIAVGVVVVCFRAPLLLAPAPTLRWFKSTIASDARIRGLGLLVLAIGAPMFWAGRSEDSFLATVLAMFGLMIVALGLVVLVLKPSLYRTIVTGMLPDGEEPNFLLWRSVGFGGVSIGVLLIYFGMQAL